MHRQLKTAAHALAACALMLLARPVRAADEPATLLRVFLRDGTSLVSYGEPARVGDRIIFSMPTGALPNPPLHLVDLPAATVDWDRTDRYAAAARADRYVKGQAELDYASLSGQLADTLNNVAGTTDPAARLTIVERARQALAEWPSAHYNYRAPEVKQMVGMLDEAIADLRAASGASRFTLTLEAHTEPPAPSEPLLPAPTLTESIEQLLNASRMADNSVERASLLATALTTVEVAKDVLPPQWAAAVTTDIQLRLRAEARVDRSYRVMSQGVLAAADRRARLGDVRGVERLITRVRQQDTLLGGKRPESVTSLVAAVEEKLDAARRLRLARDRWALRAPVLAEYRLAMQTPLALWTQIKPALDTIQALSGTSPFALASLERATARLLKLTTALAPPDEVTAPHALLISAVQLAANAASIRRQATLANDMSLAWNASSAAAGALMLGSRARTDMQSLLKPPQLR
jgi:hypothetical protein